ncbi:MAG TPA: PAS domain S-box protein [Usitatibacter sp.]|jgi:PAS domain S-box-containing protein|nr:PAS domain S-box protein [Usitatibacter sp.]
MNQAFAILDALGDGIEVFDAEWRLTYVNPAARALLAAVGADVDAMIGRKVFNELFPGDRERPDAEHFRHCMHDRVEVRFERFDVDSGRWYEHRLYPLAGGGLACCIRDITAGREAEQAIRAASADAAEELDGMRRLQALVARLIAAPDTTGALQELLDAAISLCGAERGSVQMVDARTGALRLVASKGFAASFLEGFAELRTDDDTACGRALRGGERVIVTDVERDEAYAPYRADAREARYRSVQCTPLRSSGGEILGLISTYSSRPGCAPAEALCLLDVYARLAADVAARLRAEELRRESEALLHAAEERLRVALDTARIYTWEADLVAGTIARSPNHVDVLGFALPDDVGKSLECSYPEDRPRVRQAFERAVAGDGKGVFHGESRLVDPVTGRVVWKRTHGLVMRDASGRAVRMVGITQNIDERKRAEENTRRDERNAQLAGQIDALIAPLSEPEEIIAVATRRIGEFLEVSRCYVSELADRLKILRGDWRRGGLPSLAGPHPLDGAVPADHRAALASGQSLAVMDVAADRMESDARAHLLDAGIRSFIAAPYASGLGWEATLVVACDMPREWRSDEVQVLRDVLTRLWPAVKRARAERALRESEERFRTMADSSPVMIWITTSRGQLEFANRAFLDFFGIPTRRSAAQFDWTEVIHAADRQAYLDAFRASVDARASFVARARVRRRDGQWRWIESRANPRLDAEGRVTGVIGSSPDITEMFESQEALREADRRKDEFLAMLAHELRNPLAPIVNATRILRRLAPLEPQVEDMRELIERQAEQLTTLVDDLLEVSRITQGHIALRKANVEVMSIVARAIETSRPLIDSRHHHLAVSLPTDPVRVEGDVARLAQAISNLLNNAAKYTDDGGEIALRVEVEHGEALIRVKDNGIGIAGDELARVFDLFQQSERSLDRAQGGLGIGLTIVKKLAEMHGGRVEAMSEGAGRGSEFVMRLPLAPVPEDGRAAPRVVRAPVRRRCSVLVVDDNVDAATSLALLLKLDGHDVKLAHDGPGALTAARAFTPQVIVLDIGLPGMSGYEVARELRRDRAFAETMLIALTGYGQAEDRRKSKSAGFDHHLTKPIDDEALAAVFESAPGGASPAA